MGTVLVCGPDNLQAIACHLDLRESLSGVQELLASMEGLFEEEQKSEFSSDTFFLRRGLAGQVGSLVNVTCITGAAFPAPICLNFSAAPCLYSGFVACLKMSCHFLINT